MPANVMTDDLGYKCSHAGGVTLTGSARLRVEGHFVLTKPEVLAATIDAACTNKGNNLVPCTKCVEASAGTKLRVDGGLVVLADLVTKTNSQPTPGTLVATAPPHARMRSV